MDDPGRLYISCAKADEKRWRDMIVTAWSPLESSGAFEIWHSEKVADAGGGIDFHAAILLVTQDYLKDQAAEFSSLIKWRDDGRGFFWIPIEDTRYDITDLGTKNIQPAWGSQGSGQSLRTVDALQGGARKKVWTEISRLIETWWTEARPKLSVQLRDQQQGGRISIQPQPMPVPAAVHRKKDAGRQGLLLPCLIDRLPQERPIILRARPGVAAAGGKNVFVIPGPRPENPSRFADRLAQFTLPKLRDDKTLTGSLEFAVVSWPSASADDDANPPAVTDFLGEYIDNVFRAARVPAPFDAAADKVAALRPAMQNTRFVFWSEIVVANPGTTTGKLLGACFDWWAHFVSSSSAVSAIQTPIVILAVMTTKTGLGKYMPAGAAPAHVEILAEMEPIEYQDMVNWVALNDVSKASDAIYLRNQIDDFFPNRNEKFPLSVVERKVAAWITAAE